MAKQQALPTVTIKQCHTSYHKPDTKASKVGSSGKGKGCKTCLSCRTSNRQLLWFYHQTGTLKEVIFLWCCHCCATVHICVVGQCWHCQTFQDKRASIITAFAEAANFQDAICTWIQRKLHELCSNYAKFIRKHEFTMPLVCKLIL